MYQFADRVLAMVLNLVLLVILTRNLSLEKFGDYNFVQNYVFGFVVFTDLGVSTIIMRDLAARKQPAQWIIARALAMKLIIALVTFGVAAGSIGLLNYRFELTLALLLYSSTLLLSGLDVLVHWFLAELKSREVVWTGSLSLVLSFGSTLLVVWLGGSLLLLVLVLFGQALLRYSLLYVLFRRYKMNLSLTFDFRYTWQIVRQAVPLTLATLLLSFSSNSSLVLLSKLGGATEVALYSVGSRFNTILLFAPQTIMLVVFPLMVRYFNEHSETAGGEISGAARQRLEELYYKLRQYFLLGGILLGVVTTFFAAPIITLVFGAKYLPATIVLQVAIWYVILVYISITGGTLIIACNGQKVTGVIQGSGAIALLAGSIILIPLFNSLGLALASVAQVAVIVVLTEFYVYKFFQIKPFEWLTGRLAALIGLMALSCWLLSGLPVILALAVCFALYPLYVGLFGFISSDDVKLVKSYLAQIKPGRA